MHGDTHEILGLATKIVELDDNANADIGALVYIKDLDGDTEIGLMAVAECRTINSAIGKHYSQRNISQIYSESQKPNSPHN